MKEMYEQVTESMSYFTGIRNLKLINIVLRTGDTRLFNCNVVNYSTLYYFNANFHAVMFIQYA